MYFRCELKENVNAPEARGVRGGAALTQRRRGRRETRSRKAESDETITRGDGQCAAFLCAAALKLTPPSNAKLLLRRAIPLLFVLVLFAAPPDLRAHRTTDSYLALTVEEGRLSGKWDIGIADLAPLIGLKPAGGAVLNEAEIQMCLERAATYALPRLQLAGDGRPGTPRITDTKLEHHTDGIFAALEFAVEGFRDARELEISYRLFLEEDPLHRGLLMLTEGEHSQTAVFHLAASKQIFRLTSVSRAREFAAFFREGVWHIWTGYDHVMFLLALLLPAVLRRAEQGWLAVEQFRPALLNVVKIVTAFTVAHSFTLSLAALGIVNLPSRWVESAIALSVILAAANNLRPFFRGREWLVTFAFGLIHGLGFASALGELGLRRENLWQTLAAFNLGVEGGQLVIVAVFLPTAFALRATRFYQRVLVTAGSWGIILLALIWLVERVFEVRVFPK